MYFQEEKAPGKLYRKNLGETGVSWLRLVAVQLPSAQLRGVNWCYTSKPSLTRLITRRYQGQDFMNVQSVTFGKDPG